MRFFKEFKEFAIKGNAFDLAIGVIIGAAFGKIVTSLVSDIIMPPIAFVISDVKFTDIKIVLKQAGENTISLNLGNFIQTVFDFIIVALVIFSLVKIINKLKRTEEIKEDKKEKKERKEEIELLTEIRDLLAK